MKETSDVIPADMWGYNCGVVSWVKTSQNASNDFVLASEFGADVADALAGKSISSLGVIAPVFDTPTKADMTLFITYDLDDAPLAEVTVSTTGCPLTSDGYIAATPVEIGKIAESIKIEKGKPFYVGFKMNKVAADAYPIPFDGVAYSGGEGIIFKSKETENKWMIPNDSYGAACFYIGLDEMPQNMVRIVEGSMPQQVALGSSLKGEQMLINLGSNDITSVGLNFKVGNQEPVDITLDSANGGILVSDENYNLVAGPIAPKGYGYIMIDNVPVNEVGILKVEGKINKANGEANTWTSDLISGDILVLKEGYQRNVVVEEGTGTWCGWCIRGYVGMEYMAEKYKDDPTYIGIGVHSGDAMEAESYGPMIEKYFSGFPSAMLNRSEEIDPSAEELEETYKAALALPTYGKIDLELNSMDGNNIKVTSTSEFSLDEPCAIAYVLKENKVGPYIQANYYAGGGSGEMGGFESKPEKVKLIYNEVARDIVDAFGVEGSLPASVKEDEKYTHTIELPLKNIGNVDETSVVAMIINQSSGAIVNAVEKKIDSNAVKGIYDNASDTRIYNANGRIMLNGNASGEVFTLDGAKVANIAANSSANVAPGIYLVRTAGKAVKLIVR